MSILTQEVHRSLAKTKGEHIFSYFILLASTELQIGAIMICTAFIYLTIMQIFPLKNLFA